MEHLKPLSVTEIADLERRTWGTKAVTVTGVEAYRLIREVLKLRGENAMLTDLVVMAAELWHDEIENPNENSYASEALTVAAHDLVQATPRLKGRFKAGGSLR